LIIGAGVLLVLLSVYFISLSDISMRTGSFEATRSARLRALAASSALAEGPGESAAWHALSNSSAIRSLGLSRNPFVIDGAKLSALASMDYNKSKALLGLEGLDYRLSIISANGTLFYSTGAAPAPEIQSMVSERVVVYNSSPAKLKLEVWK